MWKTSNCNYNVGNFKKDLYTIAIDGQKSPGRANFSFAPNASIGTKQTIATSTKSVVHNADGTKSVIISATLESSTSLGIITVSGTAELKPFTIVVKVIFNGNGGTPSETTKDVAYGKPYGALPGVTRTGYTFLGWFTFDGTEITNNSIVNATSNHILYAHWSVNNYTVTFLSDGSIVKREQLDYQNNIAYPSNLTKTGYSIAGWDSSISSVPDHNVTIDALWEANVYVVEFDPKGGDALANSTMDVTYDDVYGELPDATRERHTFLGWFTNATGGCEVTSNSTVSIADNHTLYAQWSVVSHSVSSDSSTEMHEIGSSIDESATNFVKVVLGAKNLSKDEIEDIIKRYTGSAFAIVKHEDSNEMGDTMVVIKFTSIGAAESFVRNVRAAGGAREDRIKRECSLVMKD